MLFNSLSFLIFFPVVTILYFALPHRFRWILLLAASYFFYGCWSIRYLGLIVLSTVVDYFVALRMGSLPTKQERRPYLYVSLLFNLGILATFKYFGFAAASVQALLNLGHSTSHLSIPSLVLPVGVSFYTFQALSYTIDVYRGEKEAERHLGPFALYVSFFPQLVAGPIERSTRLMPQFHRSHEFRYEQVAGGLRRMCWGFFKKLVIADQAAVIVNAVYAHPELYPGQTLMLAAYLFAFQVYCDFSGYTDIAIGSASVLGFDLMENFQRPFAARTVQELWTRWHVSLSSWFRDYLYIPLGGNRVPAGRLYFNLILVFGLAGLWHGAAWNFVLWGLLNGVFLVVARMTFGAREALWRRCEQALSPAVRKLRSAGAVLITFHLFVFSLVVFRAGPVSNALAILRRMPSFDLSSLGLDAVMGMRRLAVLLLAIVGMEVVQYLRERRNLTADWARVPSLLRWSSYYAAVVLILAFGELGAREFFYFQF